MFPAFTNDSHPDGSAFPTHDTVTTRQLRCCFVRLCVSRQDCSEFQSIYLDDLSQHCTRASRR